jgi:predicted RNA binding protein YcfA (HicA-like mRNA interferase family)
MSKFEKLLQKILSGTSDRNIDFQELCNLLSGLGFDERIKGSHPIFFKEGVEIINLQPINHQTKPYQVKQVRTIILKYKLNNEHE